MSIQRNSFARHLSILATLVVPLSLILLSSACLLSCSSSPESKNGATKNEQIKLKIWAHAGQEAERNVLNGLVGSFNASSSNIRLELTLIPEGSYNAQVQAAVAANSLPDILEFDGPFVYNYAWKGHLRPLEKLLAAETLANLLPSIRAQGTYRDKLYSVGMFDSGLGLYARKSSLEKISARIPKHPNEAWSLEEFEEMLSQLSQQDPDGKVLDLKLNYRGEWYTYAFSPVLYSAGAGLLQSPDFNRASGILDAKPAVEALSRIQNWIHQKKYVDPNVDDQAFIQARVALSWAGHWEYQRYREKFGEDLLILPLPNFGSNSKNWDSKSQNSKSQGSKSQGSKSQGSRTGQGSWNWGITSSSKYPEAAAEFLEFLMKDESLLQMSKANGAVPATKSALEKSPLYHKESPLWIFAVQLSEGFSIPRPQTPAYPVVTSAFQRAFTSIRDGAEVKEALKDAAVAIDRDIEDNRGYPDIGKN